MSSAVEALLVVSLRTVLRSNTRISSSCAFKYTGLSETRISRLNLSFQARVPYDRSLAIQRCDLFLRAAQDLTEDLLVMFAEKVGFKVFVLRPD
jgi:hypothetical protein